MYISKIWKIFLKKITETYLRFFIITISLISIFLNVFVAFFSKFKTGTFHLEKFGVFTFSLGLWTAMGCILFFFTWYPDRKSTFYEFFLKLYHYSRDLKLDDLESKLKKDDTEENVEK